MKIATLILASTAVAAGLSACASSGRYGSRDSYYGDRYGCEQASSSDRVAGTVVGAGVGALAGSAIAGNSSNTAGTVAGGVAGAIIGNQIAKKDRC